ncbi:unnamed protein product [Allacma fusca]|uniref:EF-hand domain-containing protein n=1 Tax=Allacma fusca TaxID=39272 RepID=A0A8J2JSR4_9HEXA|nr:unnamed protein product [Allacma fusca]
MEDKIKRESKQYLEKLFKKYDTLNCGAVSMADMRSIIIALLSPQEFDKEELERLMSNHIKESKYTVHNKQTNKFEVKYLKDTIDFPSAMAISVRFLVKAERENNPFSGTGLVQLRHFGPPSEKVIRNPDIQQKRRIF